MNLTFMMSRREAVLSKIIDIYAISKRYTVVFTALLAVVFVFFYFDFNNTIEVML